MGDSPFDLRPAPGCRNPTLTPEDIKGIETNLVADPFMLYAGGKWNMFFEVLNFSTDRGEIGLAVSSDGGKSWHYDGIVLAEAFHLSYPYVFEWQGQRYMIPECYKSGGIRLYRAADFPRQWEFYRTLIAGDVFVDSSIFRYDDLWWLLTSTRREGDSLSLYFARDLTGPWEIHPASPILVGDPVHARPAGRVIIVDGRIFRLAQKVAPIYGTQVTAFEITKLTPERYQERPHGNSPVLSASGTGWNAMGMHHMDAHQMSDGTWIACVDGWTAPARGLRGIFRLETR